MKGVQTGHIMLTLLILLLCGMVGHAQEIDWDNVDYTGSSIDNPRRLTVPPGRYELTESLGDAAERTYEYDVRSRPVAITAYNYRQKLDFTYGGNVSRMTWWAYGPYETERSYAYRYDGLSRLTEARYSDGEGGTGRYDVTYSYDLNGNVTALQRTGLYDNGSLKKYGLIDDLTLEYDGNMLRRVTDGCGAAPYYQGAYHFVDGADGAVEYAYDGNGNTTMDLNRRVTAVGYDTNNRPRLIEFEGGSSTAYLYDAAGVKRRTVHRVVTERPSVPGAEPQEPELSVTRTDYCGDIVYEDSLLSRINFDGGYLSFTDNAGQRLDRPVYHFYHRDHLGNNRMDIGENGSVWQICHYYPYGMLMGCSYLGESQRWKFGGKELDRVSGLDLSDFEARPYDATLGRFWRPDDLASQYHPLSPFLYCAANPLVLIDPTGTAYFWHDGKVIGTDGVDNNKIYVVKNAKGSYDGGVAGAGLSKKEINRTVKFIKQNNKDNNQSAIAGSDWVYNNCIEIEASAENRQAMVDIVSLDNGKKGTAENNNREHGGYINSEGNVVQVESGPVRDPSINGDASIINMMGVSSFHCHNSGTRTVVEQSSSSLLRSIDAKPVGPTTTTTLGYMQNPSPTDIQVAGNKTHYVFGMRDRNVYVYTREGVQAVIELSNFVTPKK